MIDVAALASTALSSALAYLGSKAVEVADEATKAAGAKVVDWLKSKLTAAADQEALEKLEASPDSAGAQMKVQGAILSRLEEEPSLAEQLKGLLDAAGVKTTTTQTMKVKGDKSISAQVAGSGNITKLGRN